MAHSFSQEVQAACPECGQAVDLEVWLIVDVGERPDLAAQIREGTIHAAPCPHCGHAGQVDAALLLYLPERESPLLFSAAQQTTAQQDGEQAAGLVNRLRESLGEAWQDGWLADGLPGAPRELLPTLLSGEDPQAALQAMMEQAAQEMERLRQEDPQAYAQMEAAARQMVEEAALESEGGEGEDLADQLIAWIQTPDWGTSEEYLQEHAAELLTDEAEAELERLRQVNSESTAIPEHQALLRRARQVGIAAMYAGIRRQRRQEGIEKALRQAGPIGGAVWRFVQAEDEQATALLQSEAGLLLTLDAGDLMRQLAQAVERAGDEALAARLAARLAQWQTARLGGGASSAMVAQAGQQVGTQTTLGDDVQGRLLSDQLEGPLAAGNRYEIGVAHFSAVGDNAVAINLLNFGAVTLRWQRPQMTRPDLLEKVVGRQDELDDLRGQLRPAQSPTQDALAIVGKGRSGAVSGMPGVGKSTLAALYAVEAAAAPESYPGGVLWLQLGPSYTSKESVQAALSGLVALAYGGDEQRFQLDLPPSFPPQTLKQIQRTLQNAIFTPQAVQHLLSGQGRLLVVVDDLWERSLWPAIRRALPPQAHILVTTRDERVARTVGQTLALGVLSLPDALALITQELPDMPESLAKRLVCVVGAHPMALRIALGDLHPADPPAEWAEALERIADRLGRGLGVDPTSLDDIDPERRLSAVLDYSYQALARGESLQPAFRALGSLAAEADFGTRAVAALLDRPQEQTRELLKTLRDRNLLRRVAVERWQQHALLRAYALAQQSPAERLAWAERHARHYLAQMRAADDAQTYYALRPDLPNLRRAFDWAAGEGRALGLAQALLGNCANLLRSQNLGLEYLDWAERTRALALQIGGPEEQGRALGSLGNALQAAATLGDRGARLRQALAAYDEALDKLRDVPLDYAQTQNNRAVLLSDLASLPGEDRGARLRQALAAYDEALALRRDVPLAYAQTQNNRANVLSDLASLPGEDRGARLRQAVQNMVAAWPVLASQAKHLRRIAERTLAQLIVALGMADFRTAWTALTEQPIPPPPADLLVSALAEQSGIGSQEEFMARLQDDPEFRRQVEELAAFAGDETGAPDTAQALAERLIAWIQTPDWAASEAFLQEHAAELLSDEAQAVLAGLQKSNPDNRAIPQHQALLQRCREVGIEAAYQAFRSMGAAGEQAAQDPAAQALAALLQVDSAEGLERTLAEHPALLELPTLEQLAALVQGAQEAGQAEMARHLLALLGILLEQYNHTHAEQVDPAEQAEFVRLHESLLPLAEGLDAELLAGLRRSLGWGLNTLGNAHAGQGEHAAAVEAYSRAIEYAPENAMLYRNRAGEYVEMGEWSLAEADVEQAAALEPDAPRLAELREALANRDS